MDRQERIDLAQWVIDYAQKYGVNEAAVFISNSRDIDIEFTGLRPGEKLYEELLTKEEEIQKTESDKILITFSNGVEKETLFEDIEKLWQFANEANLDLAISKLKQLVPEYNSFSRYDYRETSLV